MHVSAARQSTLGKPRGPKIELTKLNSPTIKLSVAREDEGWWFFRRSPTNAPHAIPYPCTLQAHNQHPCGRSERWSQGQLAPPPPALEVKIRTNTTLQALQPPSGNVHSSATPSFPSVSTTSLSSTPPSPTSASPPSAGLRPFSSTTCLVNPASNPSLSRSRSSVAPPRCEMSDSVGKSWFEVTIRASEPPV